MLRPDAQPEPHRRTTYVTVIFFLPKINFLAGVQKIIYTLSMCIN